MSDPSLIRPDSVPAPAPRSAGPAQRPGSPKWILIVAAIVTVVTVVLVGRFAARRANGDQASAHAKADNAGSKGIALVDVSIRANVPGGALKLRDKVYPLPYEGEVSAAYTAEEIVVTAPDHEGRSLRITFDRPRRVSVSLPRGSGLAEATDEEITAALDDDSEPSPSNSATAPAAATTRRSSTPRVPSGNPAGSQVAVAVPVAPPSPPVTTTASAPTSLAVQPPIAAIPSTVPPAAPQVAPGTVDPKGVKASVRAHSEEVQNCYERARIETPDLHGRVSVAATIGPSGQVLSASVASATAKSPRLHACLVDAFRGWTFPIPAGGVNGSISYGFVFD